ncbi:MAG: hypothetical protein BZY87_03930 [SAR202 cluster bacterium Io17-Chloro-G6]|nr:MAG: hypothetical protein BZY87_03930 [SAR202 cluster bacterium Io17-Chloro-G6]
MTTQNELEAIEWRAWGDDAFNASREEQKPLLLTLTATWCHWCHVLDETSYSDPRVIRLINSDFIPVRVDVDRRPDISRRYNQGGFPSVAILDGEGGLLAGRVYIPPDEMLALLERIAAGYPASTTAAGSEGHEEKREALPQRTASETSESPEDRVLRRLEEIYDSEFGGFGVEPKQPPWEGLRFLLELHTRSGEKSYLKMAVDSLDGMMTGLYDRKDQGFFRYSVSRDWKVPHYEKMIVSNANLAVVYLEAYQITRKKAYREVAAGTLEYLAGTLHDQSSGLFYSSQDAWEDFYRLPWKDRDVAEKPTVDRTSYVGWNALTASAFIKSYGVLGKSSDLRVASHLLELLWSDSWDSDSGFRHEIGGSAEELRLLEDHVMFLRASLDLHQATGDGDHLQRAAEVAGKIQDLFGAVEGGYYDVAAGDAALAGAPLAQERPVFENALFAESLAVMECLTGNEKYLKQALGALETFKSVVPNSSFLGPRQSRRVEEDEERLFMPAGSGWARAQRLLTSGPVHLVIVGSKANIATKRLLRAALKTYVPHRVVQMLDPEQDRERIESLGFPATEEPALYACMNNMCLAPIRSAQEVSRLTAARPWALTFSEIF